MKKLTICDDYLTTEDWNVLVEFKRILLPFWESTMRLEGVAVEGKLLSTLQSTDLFN